MKKDLHSGQIETKTCLEGACQNISHGLGGFTLAFPVEQSAFLKFPRQNWPLLHVLATIAILHLVFTNCLYLLGPEHFARYSIMFMSAPVIGDACKKN